MSKQRTNEGGKKPAAREKASGGWTKREPNDGGFAMSKQARGRIGGVRRER